MKSAIAFLLLLLSPEVMSQSRETWRGQIISDSTMTESIVVYNTNTQKGAVTDAQGYFSIPAKVGDTLVFSGLAIRRKKLVLTETIRRAQPFKVPLVSFVNELEIVQVAAKNNPVKPDSQRIVDQQYFDDKQSSPKNPFIYDGYGAFPNGTNFVRLYKDVVKLVRKSRGESRPMPPIDFSQTVVSQFEYSFFTKTLALDDSVIKLFLVYCEEDPKVKTFTVQTTSFELMDFMITKSAEFKRIATFGR